MSHGVSVSTKPIGWNLGFFVNAQVKDSFVVRAEANEEAEANESIEEEQNEAVQAQGDVVVAVEAESEDKVEEEEVKAPRKPRVKLGDIMGVLISLLKSIMILFIGCIENGWKMNIFVLFE